MIRKLHISAIACIAAIIFTSGPTVSQPIVDMSCKTTVGDTASCSPLVACIGSSNMYFTGQAHGWDTGTLIGTTNAGFACTGTWKARNALGLGQAEIGCSNGLRAIAYFTYIDGDTGTVIGHGTTSDGQAIQLWSGQQIQQFLINETGDINARLMCGNAEIPLS